MKKSVILFLLAMVGLAYTPSYGVENPQGEPGFLSPSEAPNSLKILPPPPKKGSKEFAADQAAYQKTKKLRDTPRGQQAVNDAIDSAEAILKDFSPAFGMELSSDKTPQIYTLIRKVLMDGSKYSTIDAKNHYKRVRPFVYYNEHSCAVNQEKDIRNEGSYPSGHTTRGTAVAMILADINPSKKKELLARGTEYGESRVICGAHWQSDVDAGKITGIALVKALKKNKGYQAQFLKAKEEFKNLKQQG